MAIDTRGLKYTLQADTTAGNASLANSEKQLERLNTAADRGSVAMLKFGAQGQLSARQIQALGYQTTDIFTQLAGGQSPLLVLLQQGGQLRDQFGGFGNLFRAITQVLTPMKLALGGAAAAAGVLGVAAYSGQRELDDFNKGLALTGNVAGLTRTDLGRLSKDLAEFSGNSIGQSREAVASLGASGAFTSESLASVGRAAVLMQRVSGESLDSIVKRYAGARDNVTQWAIAANKTYNYLSAAQVQNIRELEAQGRGQEAMKVNFEALAETLKTRVVPELGTFENLWQRISNAFSEIIAKQKQLLLPDTADQALVKLERRIADAERSGNQYGKLRLESDRESLRLLKQAGLSQAERAEAAAADAARNQLEILKGSKAYVEALAAQEGAAFTLMIAQRRVFNADMGGLVDAYYKTGELTANEYRLNLIDRARRELDEEQKLLLVAQDIERLRVVEKPDQFPEQVIAKRTRLIGIETQLVALSAKRAELERRITGTEFPAQTAFARDELETANQQLRRLEVSQYEANDKLLVERDRAISDQRRTQGQQLLEQTRTLNAALVTDEKARGEATIAADVQEWGRRLQIQGASGDERQRLDEMLADYALARESELTEAQDEEWGRRLQIQRGRVDERQRLDEMLANYTLARERELTEQLKPEWKRRLDQYQNTTLLMRDGYNQVMDQMGRAGEDAFAELVSTGKTSSKRLVQIIESELARIAWRRYLATPFASGIDGLLKLLGLGGGGAGVDNIGGGSTVAPLDMHTGGIAGQATSLSRRLPTTVVAGAPRYHRGGLAGDEVPAVLRRGEEVLTADNPRHRNNARAAPTVVQYITYNVPSGMTPAGYAAALERNNQRLKAEAAADAARPGRPLHNATRY